MGTDDETDRPQQVTGVIVKIVGVAVAIGLVIGIGAWVLVKAIGLDTNNASSTGPSSVQAITPLPTTALPTPSSSVPTDGVTGLATPGASTTGALNLTAAPVFVNPMERINLTGSWPGHDNESLLVQRLEGSNWSDFGVHVNVNVGTFETYVMTGRTGDQKFRVYDPTTKTASNAVTVTVGS